MHELAITQDLVDLVAERTAGRQVVAVNVRVGTESGIVPDSMVFSFDVVTLETPLEGARLVIEEVEGNDLSLVSVELVKEESCA
ncbi:MAG TPA: hydrogenase maturation nickel metallochaperone HypA [Nocardioidaceae bacterium]|nr:hydrogenase maturation nickel metallochaperone HypA [Nocardioidaceae bacterium]